jgi:hypothetical protein
VEPRPPKQSKRKADPRFEEDVPLGILVTAKRIGFSFSELNLLSLEDYVSFCEMWTGEDEDAPRRATQADIDTMLG